MYSTRKQLAWKKDLRVLYSNVLQVMTIMLFFKVCKSLDNPLKVKFRIRAPTFRGPGRIIVYPTPDLRNESSPAWRNFNNKSISSVKITQNTHEKNLFKQSKVKMTK